MGDAKTIDKMAGTLADLRLIQVAQCEAIKALCVLLDADGGVTGTNYASTLAGYLTIDATNHKVTPV